MKRLTPRFVVNLIIDVLLLLVSVVHIPSVIERPGAPFEVGDSSHRTVVTHLKNVVPSGGLEAGDRLLTWNGEGIPRPEAVEFLGDLGKIGQRVTVRYERAGVERQTVVTLIAYYSSPRFIIIAFTVGFIIWMTALFILWSAPPGAAATSLHWTMIAFGVASMMTLGAVRPESFMSILDRFLFHVSYGMLSPLFLYFTFLYPTPKMKSGKITALSIFFPAVILIAGLNYFHLQDIDAGSVDHFASFQFLFDLFHLSLFFYIGGAVISIAYTLNRAQSSEERKRMQWIAWGLCIGASPFLFLHILPQLLFSRYIMAEEYATIFFLAVPLSFAVSFLRYRLLDIEVLINRSIVYALLTLFMMVAFALLFLLTTTTFGAKAAFEEYLLIAGVALLMALFFSPARDRLQRVIDETLFAARANYRAALRTISEDLHRSLTSDQLYRTLVLRLYDVIPASVLAVYCREERSLRRCAQEGEGAPDMIFLPDPVRQALESTSVHALPGAVGNVSHRIGHTDWLERSGFSVCVSLTNQTGHLAGVVLLSPKRKGDKVREEELDLVLNGCAHASEILERLRFQERVILEGEEKKRLQELSDLKSYFVSSVSHELRMPLTSIRMFSETLRLGRSTSARQRREYLGIIEGESGRLDRLIRNVLDFARIERGVKEYTFAPTDIRKVAGRAVNSLKYEFRSAGAKLIVRIPKRLPLLHADADALEEVIINLLSNGLKYSVAKKEVRLLIRRKQRSVVLEVQDRGIGIRQEDLNHIFDRFYRVRDARSQQVGGTGLGLPLVKHIVEAHQGTMRVQSRVGKGTTITVHIPFAHENHSTG